jgi:diguanylate cyclase (GGDEF)-like protein/putative nucleotidyltransferase with HDIG domain
VSELVENLPNNNSEQSQSKGEFLDAIRRHICQILGFDFGFIDVLSGHEIKNVASFCFDDEADVAGEFVEALLDENKQAVTVANTLVAQKVRQTKRPWVGKAYSVEDIEKGLDEETEGFPYMIVPVLSNPGAGEGEVTGLIRVISFDASRDITSQDTMTLKLMGEHLASRTGLFGEFTASAATAKTTDKVGDFDNVLVVHSNRLVRRRFNRILGSSYHVIEAESSEKALETLDGTRIDVILVDSELQGASGFGFCKVLKESTKWKHIPVILVVTENSTSARVEGLNVGADDCIPDSCFDAELLARVGSSLRHRKSERELSVQLQLLEDYAQRLEKAHEQLSIDRQDTIQRNSQLEQLRREGEVQRHQDNLLHRISNIIRKSFNIRENLEEMLEALSGWFSLDSTFIVMPNEAEPEDTVRVECVSDKAYKVVAYDRDLDIYEIFKKNFQADQAIISNDAASDRRLDPFHKILKSGFSVQSLFFIPITYEQKLQGLLVGYKCEARANWSRINETFMKSVVDQVAVGVVNARLYATVQRQATTDGLTGLFNHRTGQEKLADQMKQAERYQRRISVIMLDVDHFKSINDTYGHPAGDTVLKSVARLIRNNCRDVDIPVRYGGEEFLLVLPEVHQDGATVVAERIRVALKGETIRHEDVEIKITGSFGVACFPDDADSQQYLLDLADKALYLSKRLGRDQVHTASDLMFEPEVEEDKKTEDVAKGVRDGSFMPPVISEEARQHEELVPEVVDMVKSLAASLYAKSDYNKQHHLEVARMSELLAKVMGLSAQQVEQIRVAGLLHDVGVLQLPQELLHKEGRLTKEERDQVNQHATLGAQMLRPVRALKDICEILENHHERWDGTGYPKGLKGENIPLPARIVAIVDSYHAMISERPYRPAMTHEEALRVLKDGAGKQWDPFLIEIFSAVMKSMRETTQEVQAKVALAATLAKAGIDASGENKPAAPQMSAPNMTPGEIGHDHSHDHAHPEQQPQAQSQTQVPAAQQTQTPEQSATAVEQPRAEAQPTSISAGVTVSQPEAKPAAEQTSTPPATEEGVIEEFEQRTEPSKISSVIGPVIKPIGPRVDSPNDERTGTQSLLKFVEEATEASTRSDEHIPVTVVPDGAPNPIPESTRVPLPAVEEPGPAAPQGQPSQAQTAQAQAQAQPSPQPAQVASAQPQPQPQPPSQPQAPSASLDPASVPPAQIPAGQVPQQQAQPPAPNGTHPEAAQTPASTDSIPPGLPEKRGFGVPGPGGNAPTGQLAGLVRPTTQNLAIPTAIAHQAAQQAAQQAQPSAVPGQATPQMMQGTPPQTGAPLPQQPGQPGVAQQTGQPGMPPQQMMQQQQSMPSQQGQPGTAPQQSMPQSGVPQQAGQVGMPQQPGVHPGMTPPAGQPGMPPQGPPGSSYNRIPAQPPAPGMPPGPPGSSYNRLPAQTAPGMPPPGPGTSNTRLPAQVPFGAPQPAVPPATPPQPASGPLPTQMPQPDLATSPETQGYPRPYAAGQPIPYQPGQPAAPQVVQTQALQAVPGQPAQLQQQGAVQIQPAPQQPQPQGQPTQAPMPALQPLQAQPQPSTLYQPPNQFPGPKLNQQTVNTGGGGMPQAIPQQAPQQLPQPTPQQAPLPIPQQAPQPAPQQLPPQATQPIPQQAPQPMPQQVTAKPAPTATEKQPDTWDPYSDYDDEDEIEGGL